MVYSVDSGDSGDSRTAGASPFHFEALLRKKPVKSAKSRVSRTSAEAEIASLFDGSGFPSMEWSCLRFVSATLTQAVCHIRPIANCIDILQRESGFRVHEPVGAWWHGIVGNRVADFLQLVARGLSRRVRGPRRKIQMFPTLLHIAFDHQR